MILEIRIDGSTIDIYPETSIDLSERSPVADLGISVGDFSQGIKLPMTPTNRKRFQFAEQINLKDRTVVYPNFEIIDQHFGTLRGQFVLSETVEEYGSGDYDGDFFTNLLGIDIFNTPLSEAVDKVVNLGSTTAAIIAAAKAQNAAAMSTDGVTGAVMKFVPHHNPEFYPVKDHPDWDVEAEAYDPARAYEVGEVVVEALTLLDITAKYICITAAAIAESPYKAPAKWRRYPGSILNDWDAENAAFYTNKTEFIGSRFYMNKHALVPWLQRHDVIRAMMSFLGYTVEGEYMEDIHEQRALDYSNFALDKLNAYATRFEFYDDFQDANYGEVPVAEPFATPNMVVTDPTADNDANGLFDAIDQLFDISRKGVIQLSGQGTLFVADGGQPTIFYVYLMDELDTILATGVFPYEAGAYGSGGLLMDFELTWNYDYTGDDDTETIRLKPSFRITGAGIDPIDVAIMLEFKMQMANITYEGLNIYDGNVRYADHMPAGTVAEYLTSLRQWKNLRLDFRGKDRVLRMDYADRDLLTSRGALDIDPYKIGRERVQLKPKKRFELNYGKLPGNTNTEFPGFTKIDALDSIEQLRILIPTFVLSPTDQKAVFIRNLNVWMLTAVSELTGRTVWKLHSHGYPTLRLDEQGELMSILPGLGPVEMAYFRSFSGEVYSAFRTYGEGRSNAIPLNGSRPDRLVAYWMGIDSSTVTGGYPYATTTVYNSAGLQIFTQSMDWLDIYQNNWKRTLQSIVLEELITRTFILPPDIRNSIQWKQLLLLSHSPMQLIERIRSLGRSRKTEMDLRKLKKVELLLVNEIVEIPEPEPEVYIPTLNQKMYLDGTTCYVDITDSVRGFQSTGATLVLTFNPDPTTHFFNSGQQPFIFDVRPGDNNILGGIAPQNIRGSKIWGAPYNYATVPIDWANQVTMVIVGDPDLTQWPTKITHLLENTNFYTSNPASSAFDEWLAATGITVGAVASSKTRKFQGYLSRAALWERPLTPTEVNSLILGGLPVNPTIEMMNRAVWYFLFQDDGQSIYNDGTFYRAKNWAKYTTGQEAEAAADASFVGAFRAKHDAFVIGLTADRINSAHPDYAFSALP